VGVAFTYQITATNNPDSYNAAPLPAGLSVNTTNGLISGTPTTAGVTNVTISATNQHGTGSATLVLTIVNPNLVGFRLPDFLMSAGSPNNPRLTLQIGANGATTTANRFNATLEVNAGTALAPAWVPYNHFVGITDTNPNYSFRDSWINDAALPVRQSLLSTGTPRAFGTSQLTTEVPAPAIYMKADPRATRFGIFQTDTNPTTNSRIVLSLWPSGSGTVPNGFGGTLGADVEHVPNRFSTAAYYPATFAINGPVDARDTATTTYLDNDNVTRPADAIYPGAATTTGSSTPYYSTSTYHPIMLNRPFRNVAELGYAFRDLPWKTLDFFTDKSADAGLLDIFTINDGALVLSGGVAPVINLVMPTMTAGSVNLNTTQAADLQTIFAGSILDEINSTTVSPTGTGPTDAPTLATRVVSATSTTPMQNKSELITRVTLPATILPTASNDNQAVKARREVVARTLSSVSQTRVWNLVIDVVAQSGHFKPNASSFQNDFVVEGEQHYWVHVAIDRFTGQVLDKQIEVVNE
jgi:Putative Ig domain.